MCEGCKALTRELYAVKDELTASRQNVAILEMSLSVERSRRSELTFYTVEQVAAVLQVSPSTIYNYVTQGLLSAFQPEKGGVIRIRHEDMMNFVTAFTRERFESL